MKYTVQRSQTEEFQYNIYLSMWAALKTTSNSPPSSCAAFCAISAASRSRDSSNKNWPGSPTENCIVRMQRGNLERSITDRVAVGEHSLAIRRPTTNLTFLSLNCSGELATKQRIYTLRTYIIELWRTLTCLGEDLGGSENCNVLTLVFRKYSTRMLNRRVDWDLNFKV